MNRGTQNSACCTTQNNVVPAVLLGNCNRIVVPGWLGQKGILGQKRWRKHCLVRVTHLFQSSPHCVAWFWQEHELRGPCSVPSTAPTAMGRAGRAWATGAGRHWGFAFSTKLLFSFSESSCRWYLNAGARLNAEETWWEPPMKEHRKVPSAFTQGVTSVRRLGTSWIWCKLLLYSNLFKSQRIFRAGSTLSRPHTWRCQEPPRSPLSAPRAIPGLGPEPPEHRFPRPPSRQAPEPPARPQRPGPRGVPGASRGLPPAPGAAPGGGGAAPSAAGPGGGSGRTGRGDGGGGERVPESPRQDPDRLPPRYGSAGRAAPSPAGSSPPRCRAGGACGGRPRASPAAGGAGAREREVWSAGAWAGCRRAGDGERGRGGLRRPQRGRTRGCGRPAVPGRARSRPSLSPRFDSCEDASSVQHRICFQMLVGAA